jgi:inosine/guanosine/xanthosine phosphorylase family protein
MKIDASSSQWFNETLSRSPQEQLRIINQPNALGQQEYRGLYSHIMRKVGADLRHWMDISSSMRGIELPQVSVVLGSGLGSLTSQLEIVARRTFLDCGLPVPSADGHAGEFILAALEGRGVLLQSGRIHCYENWSPAVVALSARAQAVAGIQTFILTNAAGGLDPRVSVGDLVLLTGHRGAQNHSPSNSLYDASGEDTGPFGAKFYPVNEMYDPQLRLRFGEIAKSLGITPHVGVYQFMPGPRYEEPHEIAEFARLREAALAQVKPQSALIAVGMSTAPEVYALAQLKTNPHYSGIKILGISNITNKAAGISGSVPTLEEVLEAGPIGGNKIAAVLQKLIPAITSDS